MIKSSKIFLAAFCVSNALVGVVWMIPALLVAFLTVALAGMTPPTSILTELFFLISPPALFLIAAFVAAPPVAGRTSWKIAGSAAITASNVLYLTLNQFARLPLTMIYKGILNAAGAHH